MKNPRRTDAAPHILYGKVLINRAIEANVNIAQKNGGALYLFPLK